MKTVIMAGGRGTRIASVNSEVPKPMIPIAGKPILEWQIECLRRQGLTEVILVVGYLGHIIREYFGDGSRFGVSVSYVVEEEPLGTAGALYLLKDTLAGDDFLLLCGDIIFDVDFSRFLAYHRQKGGVATLLTHPNSHPYDSGIIEADEDGRITGWLHKEEERLWYRNRVNAGIHLFSDRILSRFTCLKKTDLDREVLKPLISEGTLYAYDSPEYVKDMGTPDRYYSVTRDIESGLVEAKNLAHTQRAVFLDRDGTINRYVGFLRNIDDFTLLPRAAEAVKLINESGLLAIVVTNQPVIARGEVTTAELDTIHRKMETLLGAEGAYLDAVYYCPHHPDRGFAGEIPALKIDCDCRKPKPGLLLRAARDYHIDLSRSYMIGDGDNDMAAGRAAGCTVARIGEIGDADYAGDSLFSCVQQILKEMSK